MDFFVAAFAILGAILLGAISPGPSFVLVARTAVAVSRLDALATALGMGVGGLIFAGAALLGLMAVLETVPWLYLAIKVLGASYLIYLAMRLWKGANSKLRATEVYEGDVRGTLRSFGLGLATR